MTVRPGRDWGQAAEGPVDLVVAGGDPELAAALVGGPPNPVVRFTPAPDSDLARAVGLSSYAGEDARVAVPMDVLRLTGGEGRLSAGEEARESPGAEGREIPGGAASESADGGMAVNAVVVGPGPDRLRGWHRRRPVTVEVDGRTAFSGRAATVAVLNGQYLRGADLSPRGHPGDGVVEVHVYALSPGQRSGLRRRLGTGSHLPHPDITTRRGTTVSVHFGRPVRLEVDGRPAGRVASLAVDVVPAAYRLLV